MGKSKSWMYFLIMLTDSNTYSLQSGTIIDTMIEFIIDLARSIRSIKKCGILTRRYFVLDTKCGNREV